MKQKSQKESICHTDDIILRHDNDLERIILGSLLIESTAIIEVADILKPEVFYLPEHRLIYTAIRDIFRRGEPVDMMVVCQELKKAGKLEEAGSYGYITDLTGYVASTVNLVNHCKYLLDLYLSRRVHMAGLELIRKANDQTKDVSDTITDAIKTVEAIQQETEYSNQSESISSLSLQCMRMYEERKEMAAKGIKSGITTGLRGLDECTGGFMPGQLIILAARPAMGKTAMMLHFAKSAALAGKNVCIYSLEMGGTSLVDRLIVSASGVDSGRYRKGRLTDQEEMQMFEGLNTLSGLTIDVDPSPNITIHQIKARARGKQMKKACDMILIDYLQLIDMRHENRSYNREQEISQTSRAAKIMAKELGVPVVLLSQLSRKVEDRSDKTPLLSDLRESGAIEQDADVVLFLHRPEYYNPAAEKGKGEIKIAKQRDGQTGKIPFAYNESLTRIFNYGTDPDNTPPF